MDIKVIPLFPILINYIEVKNFTDYKDEFISEIYSYKKNNEGVKFSNKGGYQSIPNFYVGNSLSKYLEIFETHLDSVKSVYSNKKIKVKSAWFNINFPGSHNMVHTHPTSTLTGVWWLKVPENSGNLVIESPFEYTQHKVINSLDARVKEQFNIYDCYHLKPKEGTIVLFPSDIRHSVETNDSIEDRISIAFNLEFEE